MQPRAVRRCPRPLRANLQKGAKLASKKNFHVVDPANPDDILLLLGKLKKEGDVTTFALDFCRPISALVAVGAALSAFEAEA